MARVCLLTGGAGFIGSAFARCVLPHVDRLVVLDALTYAGHEENLADIRKQIIFVKGSITDDELVRSLFQEHRPIWIAHFAAESHVDNSITGPRVFAETNIMGTLTLLERSRELWWHAPSEFKDSFRFLHVSTDEVFGDLGATGKFTPASPYQPHSPYSATKAGSDHLARAWFHTFHLPTIVTNCSNNYGPRQHPEKLIPRMIAQALRGGDLPVYGEGQNVRDWIHVEDHVNGVILALLKGKPGATYLFGGNAERKNIEVVHALCDRLDKIRPKGNGSYRAQIRFVKDRPGHDWRYAIDGQASEIELGFKRKYEHFEAGLHATLDWYLANEDWIESVQRKKT